MKKTDFGSTLVLALGLALLAVNVTAQAPSAPAPADPNKPASPEGMPPGMQERLPFINLPPLVHYEAVNPGETFGGGDKLSTPRLIAAAVVATDNPSPKLIVDVGSFTGEFLEAFLDKFPAGRGQWTEPVDGNKVNAQRRFARFGPRVDYVIGCPGRDISLGCVPKNVDVLVTSWLSIHQNAEGIKKFYKLAYEKLPSGGWLVNLDHTSMETPEWERRFSMARLGFHALWEGPPIHHPDFKPLTVGENVEAMKAAGFEEIQVVWKSFNTVLFMARKK